MKPVIQALVSVSTKTSLLFPRYHSYIVQVCKMSDSSPRFTLYMSGTSYFAQKVMMAFFEKNEPFVEKLVDQRADDNYAKWFMQLNPIGKVPVLDDRGKIIPESEDIINHLDKQLPQAPRLVPDPNTELGREVTRFRKLLNINAGVILHGIAYNPDLAPEGKAGKSSAELDATVDGKIAKLERLANDHPDLREAYLAKIPLVRKRKDFANAEVVQKALEDLQSTLDEVESRLVERSDGTSSDTWLMGTDFTAADISLSVLLRRLSLLGLASLYFTPTKRPTLFAYFQRLQTYPTYCKLGDIATKYGVIA